MHETLRASWTAKSRSSWHIYVLLSLWLSSWLICHHHFCGSNSLVGSHGGARDYCNEPLVSLCGTKPKLYISTTMIIINNHKSHSIMVKLLLIQGINTHLGVYKCCKIAQFIGKVALCWKVNHCYIIVPFISVFLFKKKLLGL